jgi:threonylcarbamoyladenosine tRNA methylthiotransferase MtaB
MSLISKKVFVKTLGCKVNSFDSRVIENQFIQSGCKITSSAENSDLIVLNTCSVTQNAEKEARYLLRRYRRENPNATRIVTGCYAQVQAKELENLEEVDLVVDNEFKHEVVNRVRDFLSSTVTKKIPTSTNKQKIYHFRSALTLFDKPMLEKTRAILKIQDGCNGFCAYCQIPYARGSSRSVSPLQIISQVQNTIKEGISEIVLTGIDIGDYGKDLKEKNSLPQIIHDILQIKGLKRLRISSIDPSDISKKLLDAVSSYSDIFCAHFHIPLQSGADPILKKMGRSYDATFFKNIVMLIRSYFPKASISADIIPGFPGEKNEDFLNTIELIKECQLSFLHVFPYSKRPNTRALKMPEHLNPQIIQQRARELRNLSKQLHLKFSQKWIGTTQEVLWEDKIDTLGRKLGKTREYLPIVLAKHESNQADLQAGQYSQVKIKGLIEQNLLGILK